MHYTRYKNKKWNMASFVQGTRGKNLLNGDSNSQAWLVWLKHQCSYDSQLLHKGLHRMMCYWASSGSRLGRTLHSLRACMHREQQQHNCPPKQWHEKSCEDKEISVLTKRGSWLGRSPTERLIRWSKTDFYRAAFAFGVLCAWTHGGGQGEQNQMHKTVTYTIAS